MPKHHLVGISGSLREGSYNTVILNSLAERLTGTATMDVISIGDLPHYSEDLDIGGGPEAVAAFRSVIARADGVVIATPEYNHGIPGSLKNALDWASRPYGRAALFGKDVFTITSSPGAVGGARAHAQLNETLASIAARVVLRPQSVVSGVANKVENGKLTDETVLTFLLAGVDDLLRNAGAPRLADHEEA